MRGSTRTDVPESHVDEAMERGEERVKARHEGRTGGKRNYGLVPKYECA